MWTKVVVTITALVVFGACANEATEDSASEPEVTSEPAGSPTGSKAYEGLWKLIEGSGPEGDVPVVKGWDVTGHIDNDEIFGDRSAIFGDTGCNYYLQPIEIVGTSIEFGRGGDLNQMGCGGPAPEDTYLAALYAATEIARDGDLLVLSSPDSRLVFEPVSAPPVDAIVERRWRLRKVVATFPRKEMIAVRGELLLHRGGTFEGSAGCARLRGKWIVEGDRVMFTESASRGRCSQAELRLNGPVEGALGEGFTTDVQGNKLTIFATRSRDRLVYRTRQSQ